VNIASNSLWRLVLSISRSSEDDELEDEFRFHIEMMTNENIAADERASDQFAEHRRFQPKLQIARDLFERAPDMVLIFEQLRVGRVFESEVLCGRKHFVKRRRVA